MANTENPEETTETPENAQWVYETKKMSYF